MDPLLTSDGRPYGPVRYQQIVEERYQISKHINTSYSYLGELTPLERRYLLEFVKRDLEEKNKIIQEQMKKSN